MRSTAITASLEMFVALTASLAIQLVSYMVCIATVGV